MASPWFVSGTVKNPEAGSRLFCFPFAAGSGYEFRTWGEQLDGVDLLGVFYPGRSSRFRTPFIDNMEEMVESLLVELEPFQDKPYAFFGHSLGALIAFELSRSLRRAGMAAPEFLCASSCDAPHLLPTPPILHNLSDADFVEEIRNFGGTPEAVLNHPELLALMLPVMRADLKLLETYQYQEEAPLDIPVYAVGGSADNIVPTENILAWERHTTGRWESRFFEGGHFHLREDTNNQLLPYLQTILEKEKLVD
ncbi:MAG: alpha/beta fold hydrolase [Candidatus Promineifilaceae bacterium]